MVALTDILPVVKVVHGVDVVGISAESLGKLFVRFPALAQVANGNGATVAKEVLKIAPEAVGAIIAAGCGFCDDPGAERAAHSFPLESQFDLLETIGAITFPSGFGPFVARVRAAMTGMAVAPTKDQDTK